MLAFQQLQAAYSNLKHNMFKMLEGITDPDMFYDDDNDSDDGNGYGSSPHVPKTPQNQGYNYMQTHVATPMPVYFSMPQNAYMGTGSTGYNEIHQNMGIVPINQQQTDYYNQRADLDVQNQDTSSDENPYSYLSKKGIIAAISVTPPPNEYTNIITFRNSDKNSSLKVGFPSNQSKK